MGIYVVSGDRDTSDITPEKILAHYREAGFIYPEKEKRMAPFFDKALNDWRDLLSVTPKHYHLHISRDDSGAICASVAAFRDGSDLFTVQHAVSSGAPDHLLACMLSGVTTSTKADVNNMCMYFTPKNRWANRLANALDATHPENATDRVTFDYYYTTCKTKSFSTIPANSFVDLNDVIPLLIKSQGTQRTNALGIENFSPVEKQLPTSPSCFYFSLEEEGKIKRNVCIIPHYQKDTLLGVGLVFTSPHTINFSHLCSRIEIHIDPDAENKIAITKQIAQSTFAYISSAGFQVATMLIPSSLGLSTYQLPEFNYPVKQYCCYLWKADGDAGFASHAIALGSMYAQIKASTMLRQKKSSRNKSFTVKD